jgi:hypothetical protein
MKTQTGPRTWICKTNKDNSKGFVVAYKALIAAKAAGFSLVNIDPQLYASAKELSSDIGVGKAQPGFFTGRTFGQQIWDICHNAKPGDRIFLECPNVADKKPKSKKMTSFIVAAGIVTGPFKYSPNDKGTTGNVSTGVDWQWTGQELIEYGHGIYCFIGIKGNTPGNKALLERLEVIFKTKPRSEIGAKEGPITKPDPKTALEFDSDWQEGDAKMRHHLTIERCSRAALVAKNLARKASGELSCEACGITPSKAYGHELIDAHHIIPLADTKGMCRKPSAGDFAMLCPTCHRAVHKELKAGAVGREAIMRTKKRFKIR